jgi:spore maturation protein CgeB
LNAPDGTRDVTANEELFEIAASGRVSLNLASPEVRECYDKNEIVVAKSEDELEKAARQILRDPAEALAMGENARRRTAREHLWEHRLREVLA